MKIIINDHRKDVNGQDATPASRHFREVTMLMKMQYLPLLSNLKKIILTRTRRRNELYSKNECTSNFRLSNRLV